MASQVAKSIAREKLRVCICGGGIAGLSLAAVLSKELEEKVSIDVYERSGPDRDQGYGLDLGKDGHSALRRSGCFHRYWEISRPNSDVWNVFGLRGDRIGHMLVPSFLQRFVPANPESNRGLLREILLDSLNQDNCKVSHYAHCSDVKLQKTSNGQVEAVVTGEGEATLGTYDLVVDAAGVHSPLRHLRATDAGEVYSGSTLIHGVINDPEAVASEELTGKLGQGTCAVLSRDFMLVLQRFGVGRGDNRTAFFLGVTAGEEDAVRREICLPIAHSRRSGNITDPELLGKVKSYLHEKISREAAEEWHEAIDVLDRVTVRPEMQHAGGTKLVVDETGTSPLPIICIGDSLRNCGLGGGGNLALKDSVRLADLVAKMAESGKVDVSALRELENKMLKEKLRFYEQKVRQQAHTKAMHERVRQGADRCCTLRAYVADMGLPWPLPYAVSMVAWLTRVMWDMEMRLRGRTGDAVLRKE